MRNRTNVVTCLFVVLAGLMTISSCMTTHEDMAMVIQPMDYTKFSPKKQAEIVNIVDFLESNLTVTPATGYPKFLEMMNKLTGVDIPIDKALDVFNKEINGLKDQQTTHERLKNQLEAEFKSEKLFREDEIKAAKRSLQLANTSIADSTKALDEGKAALKKNLDDQDYRNQYMVKATALRNQEAGQYVIDVQNIQKGIEVIKGAVPFLSTIYDKLGVKNPYKATSLLQLGDDAAKSMMQEIMAKSKEMTFTLKAANALGFAEVRGILSVFTELAVAIKNKAEPASAGTSSGTSTAPASKEAILSKLSGMIDQMKQKLEGILDVINKRETERIKVYLQERETIIGILAQLVSVENNIRAFIGWHQSNLDMMVLVMDSANAKVDRNGKLLVQSQAVTQQFLDEYNKATPARQTQIKLYEKVRDFILKYFNDKVSKKSLEPEDDEFIQIPVRWSGFLKPNQPRTLGKDAGNDDDDENEDEFDLQEPLKLV